MININNFPFKSFLFRTSVMSLVLFYMVFSIRAQAVDLLDLQAIRRGHPFYGPCDTGGGASDAATGGAAGGAEPAGGGVEIGASVYGGGYSGGKWTPSNGQQGGGGDDKGIGDHDNPLPGTVSFAELENGIALGGLKQDQKVRITYKGKSVVALRADNGGGGGDVNGKKRAIDLWWETARMLDFTNGTDIVTWEIVPDETPVTPFSGETAPEAPVSSGGVESGMCCETNGGGDLAGNAASGAALQFPIRLPLIKDADKLAQTIDSYIESTFPSSPLKGMGKYFVQGGMRSGINPLLAVAQATTESSMGTAGIATKGTNNAWGRQGSDTQPTISLGENKWYKYPSWEKSLVADAFPASGKTEQPDDWFQYVVRRYPDKLDDLNAFVPAYAPSFENDVPGYVNSVLSVAFKIAADSQGAIDLTQFGTASSGGGGDSTANTNTVKPVVVAIDPGHGGIVAEYQDGETKLGDRETDNSPEREDMLDVAKLAKEQLETDKGYKAVLLRTEADQKISKRQRMNDAEVNKAALGVSLHSDTSPIEEVWPQFVGGFRADPNNESIKVNFENKTVADQSMLYSQVMAKERSKSQHGDETSVKTVVGQSESFGKARGLPSYGDISLMQLFAKDIPWVYNETTAPAGGMTADQKLKYAEGVVNGIKAAVPPGEKTDVCAGSSSFGGGDISATTLAYAWPEYHEAPYTTKKPEYDVAITKASGEGQYVGGLGHPGVDCGGFVTRLLIDSGFEPNYNYSGKASDGASSVSGGQLPWLQANWQQITPGSTADLQPGDVMINTGATHTFVYVGEVAGFSSTAASASVSFNGTGWRSPMADKSDLLASSHTWWRKK